MSDVASSKADVSKMFAERVKDRGTIQWKEGIPGNTDSWPETTTEWHDDTVCETCKSKTCAHGGTRKPKVFRTLRTGMTPAAVVELIGSKWINADKRTVSMFKKY
eukprot:gene6129-5979_t